MSSNIDKITKSIALSAFLAYQENFVDRAKIKDSQIQTPSTDRKLLIITLMEEVRKANIYGQI